jgi:hypothetical protein
MLFWECVQFFYENHMSPVNTHLGKNAEIGMLNAVVKSLKFKG